MSPARALALLALLVCGVAGLGVGHPSAAQARPYVPKGTSVHGGANSGGATRITPGQYLDTLPKGTADVGRAGSSKYYVFTLATGETPYVTATLVPPAGAHDSSDSFGVSVTLSSPGVDACTPVDASDTGVDDRVDPVSVTASSIAGSSDSCLRAGNVVAEVDRTGDLAATTPLQVELALRIEPRASAVDQPPAAKAPQGDELQRTTLIGTPARITSGLGFATAPVLPSGVYGDTLGPGDTRYVRVHLGWGQRLAYGFSSAAQPDVSFADSLDVTTTLENPVRQDLDQPDAATDQASSVGNQDASMSGASLVPVEYRNRFSDDDSVVPYSVAGDYYLVLSADTPSSGKTTVAVPYTLTLQVFGREQRGPQYGPTPSSSAASSASASASAAAGGSGPSGVVVFAIAAGVVVVVGGVAALLLGRRRRRTPPAYLGSQR